MLMQAHRESKECVTAIHSSLAEDENYFSESLVRNNCPKV